MELEVESIPESAILETYKMAHKMEALGKKDEADKIFKKVSDALVMNFLVKIEDQMIEWVQEQININTEKKGNQDDS